MFEAEKPRQKMITVDPDTRWKPTQMFWYLITNALLFSFIFAVTNFKFRTSDKHSEHERIFGRIPFRKCWLSWFTELGGTNNPNV